MNWFFVFLGGGLGSMLRYAVTFFFYKDHVSFPWATFTANLISCFLVGFFSSMFARYSQHNELNLLLITGFCGGFSTFSTFSHETLFLIQEGKFSIAIIYTAASIALGIACVFLGSKIQI